MPAARMPVRYSPRPLRALTRRIAPVLLAIAYRLVIALAVAGTVAHAVVFWPESLLLTLAVVAFASAMVLMTREQVAA